MTPELTPEGGGLYASHPRERMPEIGYPDQQHELFFSPDVWAPLVDERGITYGPNAFYQGNVRQDHPELEVTDAWLQSRYFRVYRTKGVPEELYGRFLELLDLSLHDLVPLLEAEPQRRITVFSPRNLETYQVVTGKEYWVTHVVDGPFIVVEPIDVLFARTLAAHAARNAVALVLLDQRCHGLLPPWLREGLASYLAQEGNELVNYVYEFRNQRDVVEDPATMTRDLYPLIDREKGRVALYNAFLRVWYLAEGYGFDRIRRLLSALEEGTDLGSAVQRAYGISYEALLDKVDPRTLGEPTGPDFRPKPPGQG